jgi:hypothetical protein
VRFVEQRTLALQAAEVARQRTVGRDDPVTRHHDRDGSATDRCGHGAHAVRLSAGLGEGRVRRSAFPIDFWLAARGRADLQDFDQDDARECAQGDAELESIPDVMNIF